MEEWGNISQLELANLVQSMRRRCTAVLNAAGGHTRLLLILTPLCSETQYSIYFSHMSVELVQFVSAVESYAHTNIYTLSLLKINAFDSERTFLFLLSLCKSFILQQIY